MQLKAATIDDIMDECVEHFKRKKEAQENIFIDGEYISIQRNGSFRYEIPLSECGTVCGAVRWLKHMAEKRWVTDEILWRIADLIMDANS